MTQNERLSTNKSFKNNKNYNSSSISKFILGNKNNIKENNILIESITFKNLLNKNRKNISISESSEKEKNLENEKRRKEELNKRREISYRSRKRIILRMKQEEKNIQNNENSIENNNKKVRKFEIKLPFDKIKLKRLNSNDVIKLNPIKKKIESIHKTTIPSDIENKTNNIIDNKNKSHKCNFNFSRNIRNLYKKNMIKDINVQTEKSCKILKVEKIVIDKNTIDKGYNNTINSYIKKNDINFTNININFIKKKGIINHGTLGRENNDEAKISYDENRKTKNKNLTLKFIEGRRNRNRNFYFNMRTDNALNNTNNKNCFLFSSIKNLTRINSDYLDNSKKNKIIYDRENTKTKEENNNEIKNGNIKRFKELKNRSEIKILKKFSFFGYLKTQRKNEENENKKDIELDNKIKSTDKLKFNLVKKEKKINEENKVSLRALSSDYLKLNYNKMNMCQLENKEKNNNFNPKLYINHYFEELIDINNAIDDRNLLKTLLNNFNRKYFLNNENYNKNEYNLFFKENDNFEYIFKHFGLVLICLIFFAKDNLLFSEYNSKVKEFLLQLIYSSLNYVEIDGNKSTNKINNFIKDNNFQSVISNHRYLSSLICLLFDNKKEYLPLRNALEQLYETITKKDYQFLTEVINNSILYCYNSKPKCLFSFSIFRSKNNILTMKESPEFQNNKSNNNNIVSTENLPSIPFIKSSMKKKFCLVLDIDETISHSLKLSFGCYFLVRPGALDFLKEISKYYEIIIFTSSPKIYADKILNKIDINGNLISHRLYRNHVIYENGKSAKNLNMIGRDLTKTIFIDNLMSNAKYNLNNLCPITTWISDIFDDKLIKLKNKLVYIATSGKYDDDITQGL